MRRKYSETPAPIAALEIIHEVRNKSVPKIPVDALAPGRAALLVYDMQVGVARQLKDAAGLTAKVADVLGAARAAGMAVFFVRHTSLPRRLMGTFQLRQAMLWQRKDSPDDVVPWFLPGTPSHAIVPELTPREDEAIFDKIGMSAFEGTPLAVALRDLGIDCVAVVGAAIEIGIEPTVRHAADLGFVPVLIEDALAAGHAEAGERAMASLRFIGDAMFCDVEAFKSAIG